MAHYVKKNGVLTPLNGRSAQDYLEAKGRIVVDISTQQVGDVIRVRSLLDPTQVWNKEITAAGDYMVFDVPCKDIYAICLVRDVEGTPTEFNNKNKAVDYGQIVLTDVLPEDPVDLKQIYVLNPWTVDEYQTSGRTMNFNNDCINTSVYLQPTTANSHATWSPSWYNVRRFKKLTVTFSRTNQTITSSGNTGTSYTRLLLYANQTSTVFHTINDDVIDHEVSLDFVDELIIRINTYASGNYGGWPLTTGTISKLILS